MKAKKERKTNQFATLLHPVIKCSFKQLKIISASKCVLLVPSGIPQRTDLHFYYGIGPFFLTQGALPYTTWVYICTADVFHQATVTPSQIKSVHSYEITWNDIIQYARIILSRWEVHPSVHQPKPVCVAARDLVLPQSEEHSGCSTMNEFISVF